MRLIDVEAVKEDLKQNTPQYMWGEVLTTVNIQPCIDIVLCRECKYASDNKVYGCMLNHFNDNDYDYHRMYADDFCSYGERETND